MGWVELGFMMVILKIPVVYVCLVVYWAIRAEPEPLEGAPRLVPVAPDPNAADWRRRRLRPRRPRGGPHGSPARRQARARRARAEP